MRRCIPRYIVGRGVGNVCDGVRLAKRGGCGSNKHLRAGGLRRCPQTVSVDKTELKPDDRLSCACPPRVSLIDISR
jgi:hypothetical protein